MNLYTLADDAPEIGSVGDNGPVLLYHFEGFLDAGAAGRLAVNHLLSELEHSTVATFDTDRLLDYRSRRPVMTFDTDHWAAYTPPQLAVYSVKDTMGTPFLVLRGPEPDREWEGFVKAVGELADRLGVSKMITVQGLPLAVPHTRPLSVSAHATRPELIGNAPTSPFGSADGPASVAGLLQFRLGEKGRDALGYAVHVPHYLSQAEYPQSAIAVLEAVTKNTGLVFPMESLHAVAELTNEEIEEQVRASTELTNAITTLEQQYDTFSGATEQGNPRAADIPMPTGDELAAQFEQFLAERDERE